MMEFTSTLLPELVAPPMSRCGVWIRSMTCASPRMSLPSARGISYGDFCITSREIISLKETMERTRLGTSMPTACRPGIGATMRTLGAARRSAMLSDRLAILDTRTPCAGSTSKSVMTGPLRMPVTSASMLNSFSASVRILEARLVSSSMIQYSLSPRFFRTSCTGMLYLAPAAGFGKGSSSCSGPGVSITEGALGLARRGRPLSTGERPTASGSTRSSSAAGSSGSGSSSFCSSTASGAASASFAAR